MFREGPEVGVLTVSTKYENKGKSVFGVVKSFISVNREGSLIWESFVWDLLRDSKVFLLLFSS